MFSYKGCQGRTDKTSFEAPNGILSELRSVKLGEGIATDVQMVEYRRH